jgi:hypothetical protein
VTNPAFACIVGRRRRAAVPSAFNRDGGEAGRRRVTPGTRNARPASTPCGCRSRAFGWWAREESSTQPTSQGWLTLRSAGGVSNGGAEGPNKCQTRALVRYRPRLRQTQSTALPCARLGAFRRAGPEPDGNCQCDEDRLREPARVPFHRL